MKPYQKIPIKECGESLAAIPQATFSLTSPHPYEKLGAPYEGKSPYYLRQSVLDALIQAQDYLNQTYPQWQIQIFDAYRPVAVQQFMVDYTFNQLLHSEGLQDRELSEAQKQQLWQQVYQIWAIPSDNPATPPPHSTGAAVDITLVDATGKVVDMGGEIDELSARSQPNYHATNNNQTAQEYHNRRQLLNQIMTQAGFIRHPGEWWHFSLGDQMWAWLYNQKQPVDNNQAIARYGKIV